MTNRAAIIRVVLGTCLLAAPLAWTACSNATGTAKEQTTPPAAVQVGTIVAAQQPIERFIRATGTLMAEEHADVAAETAGRVISTPIERGTAVAAGAELVRMSAVETDAQLAEAEANAAQMEARLGLAGGREFEIDAVPEVQNAKAALALAESEFGRIQALLAERVVSQSEFDQRKAQMDAARQLYVSSRNGATQQYQALLAARARVSLARKASADTVVRAPFAGVVGERLVSVGDFVSRGTKIAQVMRVNPLRAQLTVPEQFLSAVAVGAPITFEVDPYPGRQFTGTIRYVSPGLQADRRALTIEALVPNPGGELKPGLFTTARIQQPTPTPAIIVPATAVQVTSGTSRVYVVSGDHVDERIVATGQLVGDGIEITSGLKPGERVVTTNVGKLADGTRVVAGQ